MMRPFTLVLGLLACHASACRAELSAAKSDAPTPDARPHATLDAAAMQGASGDSAEPSSPTVARATPEPAESPAASAPGMLLVPAGTFTMGADSGGEADERPAHPVTLPAFWLDRTHVTNAAYAVCVEARGCKSGDAAVASQAHAGADRDFQRPAQPIVGVSWDDAQAYCAWAGKRLPGEAEFERAMRGDDARRYPWGDERPTPERTTFGRSFGAKASTTDDVGTHPEGRGPFGHDDLAGNAWEWTADLYDPLAYVRKTANLGVPGSCTEIIRAQDELRNASKQGFTGTNPIPRECERVLRGGAFNYDFTGLRATNRVHHPGRFRIVMAGFRCAKTPP